MSGVVYTARIPGGHTRGAHTTQFAGERAEALLIDQLLDQDDPRYETPRHPRRRVARGITAKSITFNEVAE